MSLQQLALSTSVRQLETNPENWLVGGGQMGNLIRSMDWTKTPLGPIASWPQSLRTTVSLCLASNFPISLAWGPKHVQIYLEETFFPFSFSPIRDETGGVGGLFHPVTETTSKMVGQRRTRVLRDLAARAAEG